MDFERSKLYNVPDGLKVIPNRGGGDCMFLALEQLMEDDEKSWDMDEVEFRKITADGLDFVMGATGNGWSAFKSLLNEHDQKIVGKIEQTFNETFNNEERKGMSVDERNAIEKDWFKEHIRQNGSVWGDNMHLIMFLKSPTNPFTRDHRINILLIDRLTTVGENMGTPLCFSSDTPGKRTLWGILVRTRTDDGEGSLHYEAAYDPEVEPFTTRYKHMYDTKTFIQIMVNSDYFGHLSKHADFFKHKH